MIDNFKLIEDSVLQFDNTDAFYYVQIIQRKNKEGNTVTRLLKSFNVRSLEHYNNLKPDIIKFCNFYNARAYINPNPRSFRRICIHMINELTECILSGTYNGKRAWDSACGKHRDSTYPALWTIDLDSKKEDELKMVISHINKCKGAFDLKIKAIIPTQNGYHLITTTFDAGTFKQRCPLKVDIHKDNPTILYIP